MLITFSVSTLVRRGAGWHDSGTFSATLYNYRTMTWSNGCAFCLLGLGMLWLPALAPWLMTPNPHFGTSTRELWLLFMGSLNTALGSGVLGWYALQSAWSIPAWLTPTAVPAEPLALPQPTRASV